MQQVQRFIPPQQQPIQALYQLGQSLWLDRSRRSIIQNGELHRLIEEEGIRGIVANLTVFQQAIARSSDYDKSLLMAAPSQSVTDLYYQLALEDAKAAADILKPLYHQSGYKDGYTSLDISPYSTKKTEQMLTEVRKLQQAVDRPNVMIKVPATPMGIPIVQQLIGEGINIYVTFIFSQTVYQQVANAYCAGLETFASKGGDIRKVASVASFPISPLDAAADSLLARRQKDFDGNSEKVILLKSLEGQMAIANARLTYQKYLKLYESDRWQTLKSKGAQPQRLLWTNTNSEHSQYSDVLYIEELIGKNTVNSIPSSTLSAFSHHGEPRYSLTEELDIAEEIIACLPEVLIDFNNLTEYLLRQSIRHSQQTFERLLNAIVKKQR